MKKSAGLFANSFFLSLLLFIVTRVLWGFYFEEYEALFDAFYSGKFSPGTPFYSWYYMGNIGISYLYAELYQLAGGIEWISWILYFYMLIACSLTLFLIKRLLQTRLSTFSILILQIFVFAFVFSDNLIHFHYTRVSYFLCGSSLLALIFLFPDGSSVKRKPFIFLLLNGLFVLGTFTRLEPAMAVIGLLFVFGVYYCSGLIQLTRLFAFPALVVALVLGGIIYDTHHTKDFYKQVEPDIETQITVRENYVPLSAMKTQSDSLKYLAAINMIWGDPKIVTPSFMRSLLTKDSAFFRDKRQWARVENSLHELLVEYWYLAVFNILIAILFFIQSYSSVPQYSKLLFILFQLSIWVLFATQTYYVKINERSFFPLLGLFSFINLMLVFMRLSQSSAAMRVSVMLVCMFGLVFQLRANTIENNILCKEREDYRYNLNVLHNLTGDNIIALNSSSFGFFTISNEPFKPFDFSAFPKVYLNEVQVLSTVHTYHEYLEKECSCNVDTLTNFYRFLQASDKKVYFLSVEDHMDLTRKYLLGMHNYNLDLKEVKVPGFRPVYDHEKAYIIELKVYTFNK